MSDWTNSDMTEVEETDSRPLLGVTGGQRAREGDSYELAFHDNGEEVETQQGKRVAFDVTFIEATFVPVDGDGNEIEPGDEVRFMTGSSRFLSALAEHYSVKGEAFEVLVDGTGYDAAYRVRPADD